MSKAYYTYRIRVANYEYVNVEKRDLNNQVIGEPDGKFGYHGELRSMIDSLVEKSQKNELLDDDSVKALGEALFEALFDEGLRRDFATLYEQVIHNEDSFLRIELNIDEAKMPEVAALPWEFMRMPTKANLGIVWLSTASNLVFSRRQAQWNIPKPIQLSENEKLRIALAVAAPSDLGPVIFDKVEAEIKKLVEDQPDKFELLPTLTNADAESIDKLLAQDPHIFHFIGHGRLFGDSTKQEGQLAFVDEMFGEADWIDADFFADLLNTHRPAIVMLHACEGGQLSSSQAFVSVASRVIQQNIPVVLAMQYEVTNDTAIRFALRFYQGLADGDPVDVAVQYGRRSVALKTQYKRRDFATPVLFMRVADGYLFLRKKGNNQAEQVKETDAVIGAKPSSDTAHSTDAGSVPLTQDAYSIHVLLQRFSINELAELANSIGLDFENLGASGKNAIAMSLMLTAQRRSRLDKLVIEIAASRPEMLNELKANLYVFMESIKESDLAQLCQELRLDCPGMKLDKKGLLGYEANKYIRTERTRALQDYMVQNGRYAELVQAVKRKLPGVDLSIFE